MPRDDTVLIQILKALYDRPNEEDDNTGENTLIQFFEAPHDTAKLTVWVQAFVAGSSISASPDEVVSLTATLQSILADPTKFTWAGFDSNGNWVDAGWNWDYGGAWA